MNRLDAIEAYCAEAAAGPWFANEWPPDVAVTDRRYIFLGEGGWVGAKGEATWGPDLLAKDTEFIAAARTDLPDLAQAFRVVGEALRNNPPPEWVGDTPDWSAAYGIVDAWLGGSSLDE